MDGSCLLLDMGRCISLLFVCIKNGKVSMVGLLVLARGTGAKLRMAREAGSKAKPHGRAHRMASAHGQTGTAVDGSRCYRIEQKKKRGEVATCVSRFAPVYI